MKDAPNLATLPTEILLQIVRELDAPAPSIKKFDAEPTVHLAHSSSTQPLKALSTTCRRFRPLVFPILFTHLRFVLDDPQPWLAPDISTPSTDSDDDSSDEAWPYPLPPLVPEILRRGKLARGVRSLALVVRCHIHDTAFARTLFRQLWNAVFGALPRLPRVVVAAPPLVMQTLADLDQIHDHSGWAFAMKTHYLELRVDAPADAVSDGIAGDDARERRDLELHLRRPWTHVGFNEGAHLPVYSTYEFHWKKPASALPELLARLIWDGTPTTRLPFMPTRAPEWVRWQSWRLSRGSAEQRRRAVARRLLGPGPASLSYVAVFPLAGHVAALATRVERLVRLRRLSVRLAPPPDGAADVLDDPARVGKADFADLWAEHRRSQQMFAELALQPAEFEIPRAGIAEVAYGVAADAEAMEELRGRMVDGGWVEREPMVWQQGEEAE